MKLTLRLANEKAEINAFRQGFILLTTAFDAAMFDIVKIALQDEFFELIDRFPLKNSKATSSPIKSFSEFKDFEDLKTRTIEERLKPIYLKELISALNDIPDIREALYTKSYAQTMELINRRNIHIHNSGRVDNRYAENHNIYGLTVGEYAKIDSEYWNKALASMNHWIEVTSEWASRLTAKQG